MTSKSSNETVITTIIDIDGFSEDINITVYRVVQECLTNIIRHSAADRVEIVVVKKRKDASSFFELEIQVADNGKGLVSWNEKETPRLGVVGMRERVQGLGGVFEIKDSSEGGVTVLARVPV